ncbi:MAG: hypothetical protein AAGF33_18415 [Pseudomonadota bacterium]
MGWVYEVENPLFAEAKDGIQISKSDEDPPWIVVYDQLSDVLPAEWPGRLWEVRVVRRLEPQGHIGSYTRALSIQIIREDAPNRLFGQNGGAVEGVIAAAQKLSVKHCKLLSLKRSPSAGEIYSEGWKRWLKQTDPDSGSNDDDFEGVLGISGQGLRSPIGAGLTLINRYVNETARKKAGDSAFEDDEGELWLNEPWSSAESALLEAALAFGASNLFNEGEADLLLGPWNELIRQ